jgi:hypothetical protein
MGGINLIKLYGRRIILQHFLPECRGKEKKARESVWNSYTSKHKDEIFNSVFGKTIGTLKILTLLLRKISIRGV